MTEPSSAEAEAEIQDGDMLPDEVDTDVLDPPVFEQDKHEDFDESEGFPDPGFEKIAFPDEGLP